MARPPEPQTNPAWLWPRRGGTHLGRFGLWLVVWLGLGWALLACKRSPPPPPPLRVTRIAIAGVGPDSEHAGDPRVIRLVEAATAGLARAGVAVQLQPATPLPADFVLRLRLQVQTSVPGEPSPTPSPGVRLRALCAGGLSLQQPPSLADRQEGSPPPQPQLEISKFDHLGMSEDDLPSQPEDAWVLARLSRLVEDSAYTLGAELQLLRADSRELLTRVADPAGDDALRATAIQILGRRREKLAIPVLIGLIRQTSSRQKEAGLVAEPPTVAPDAGAMELSQARKGAQEARRQREVRLVLRDSAIGALIEIGDRSAVRPLLDSVAFLDSAEMGKLMEAVASLGGDEAKSYLRFVKSSHPEPALRDEAAAALQRLERREGEPTPPAAP